MNKKDLILTIINELECLRRDVIEFLDDVELDDTLDVDDDVLDDIYNKIDKSRDYILDAKDSLYLNK